MSASQPESGPPYPPKIALLGGTPTVGVDVPISSVFMFLFVMAAAGHMTVLQVNQRRGHKFLMSGLMFGFCMARILALTMRIVWAVYPTDVQIGMTASIFVQIGVLILFIVNLIFTQRILRAAHPNFGWHKAFSIVFKVLYGLIAVMLVMVISATVDSFYVLGQHARQVCRDLQMTAGTYLMFISFLPIPLVIIGLLLPRKTRVEKFGTGRWRTKVGVLLASSVLLCLGASFRAGTNFKDPRPRNDPAWYQAKWCFYVFNFTIEILVIYLYLIIRVDRRFHIPNGSKGPGDYVAGEKADEEPHGTHDGRHSSSTMTRINTEEEVFDDETPLEQTSKDKDFESSPV